MVVAIVDLRLCPKENCCRPGKPLPLEDIETARLRVGATAVVQAAEVAKVTRSTLVLRVWSREDPFILDVHKS